MHDATTAAPSTTLSKLTAALAAHRLACEVIVLAGAVLVFLVSTLPHLADYPVLTDDEAWVLSASFKLAHQGVFGSDMFAGFYHADQRYYFNLPLHHLVVAAALRLLGDGIAQARLVGVGYGLATLALTYVLTRRLYGVVAAMLAIGLLLWLRLNIGFDTGLPLQELAVNLRYDLAPVPFLLAGVLVLLGRNGHAGKRASEQTQPAASCPPVRLPAAILAGALFGVATLLQFYGAFLFPVAIAFLWLEALPARHRLQLIGALLAVGALVGLPYGVYILGHYDDFRGQAGTIDQRADFTSPRFYIDNLLHEPNRFVRPLAIPYAFTEVPAGQDPFAVAPQRVGLSALARRPSAKLGVILGLPLALVFAGWRARRLGSRGDRLLLLCLAGLVVEYALFDQTKFYMYWIAVVPFLCTGLGGAIVWLLQPRPAPVVGPSRLDMLRRIGAVVTVLALLVVAGEGSIARLNGLRTARNAPSYAALAATLHGSVPPGSRVVGSTALWWGLRDTDYRSYFLFFYLTRPDAGPYRRSIDGFLDEFDAQYVVLTRVSEAELQQHLSPADYQTYQTYLQTHGMLLAHLDGPEAQPYGFVDVWRLQR